MSSEHGVGKRWQVRYRDLSGEQCKENFERRPQADSRAAKVKAELDGGTFVPRQRGRETFREVAERWRESAIHRERTTSNVERALRLHVYPTFGARQIGSIQSSDARRWMKERAAVIAPSTFATPWNCFTGVLKMAYQEGLITKHPCDGVEPPKPVYPEVQPLHPEAMKALIAASSKRYRLLVHLAAASGLRGGELFGLEEKHVTPGAVVVEQQLIGPDKGVPYLGEPKTSQSYRTVPLPKSLAAEVEAYKAAFPPREVWIEDRTNPRKPVWRSARLLFTSQNGGQLRRGSWARVWGRTVNRANRALERSGSAVRVPSAATLHDARHFYASVLISKGATPKQVQRRLGHAKPSVTLNVYTHLWETDEDQTADMIDSVLQ
ncbi:integrase [Streptomyces sp. SPB074]|nr:integrase [Streptomyces sp. SPB074]